MYFDNDAILAILNEDKEEAKKAGEINTTTVKSAANQCIKSVRTVTHEMEKIIDILIRVIQKKTPQNKKDITTLEKYKNEVSTLKNSVMAITTEIFQKNDKDINKKTMDVFKGFDKKVLYIAQKNKIEEITKTMARLPNMIMETLKSFNNYVLTNIKEVDKYAPKAEAVLKNKNNDEKSNKKPNKKEKILHEDNKIDERFLEPEKTGAVQSVTGLTKSKSESFMGGVVRGADITGTYLWHAITLRHVAGDKSDVRGYAWIHKGFNDALQHMNDLGKLWTNNIDKSGGPIGLTEFRKFFGSAEFGKTCGSILAIVGILYVLKKIWNGIRRFFDF